MIQCGVVRLLLIKSRLLSFWSQGADIQVHFISSQINYQVDYTSTRQLDNYFYAIHKRKCLADNARQNHDRIIKMKRGQRWRGIVYQNILMKGDIECKYIVRNMQNIKIEEYLRWACSVELIATLTY